MRSYSEKEQQCSLLDKLLDISELNTTPSTYSHNSDAFKLSVKRDLETLLNTRLCQSSPPKHLPNIQRSLINYGLPDLASFNFLNDSNVHEFCRIIEDCIRTHEPRITYVKVNPSKQKSKLDATIKFRIIANLIVDSENQQIIFDSNLEPIPQKIKITEVEHV